MLIVGKALKPHGIKGYIKVQSYMDSPLELKKIKAVEIEGIKYPIEDIKVSPKAVLIKLKGIDDMNAAEFFRNKELKIDRRSAPDPPKGRHYVSDLLGSRVYIENQLVGELTDILQYGSADVYQVKGEKSLMFSYAGDVIEKIDTATKEIFLNKEELEKVAVYED
ncbi:MAG: ribosome maturation factor RimM [Bacillota bacterium]|jgi:16S rRNA processing protein RimM|nr:ribosome maturation factor RimM [Bacillota bacterium]HHU43651.1 16S rRNA processing protein RimM [Clostridiales bacterium]